MRAGPVSAPRIIPFIGNFLFCQVGRTKILSGRKNGGDAVFLPGGVRLWLIFGRKEKRPRGTGAVITLSNVVIYA